MPNRAFYYNNVSGFVFVFCFTVLLLINFSACRRKPSYDVNIAHIEMDPVEVKRYEKALFTIDPYNLREEIDPYIDDFYLFLGDEINTPAGQQQLFDYITDPFIREIWEDVAEIWPSTDLLRNQLNQAFRYFRYHFPEKNTPEVYTYVSGLDFEHPVFYQDNIVVIALDMFLGRDYDNYNKVGVPVFKRIRFSPVAAPIEVMREIGHNIMLQSPFMPETLLDFMIFEGKVLYFLDSMFPAGIDSLKIYYSTDHINWAQNNEGHSWSYLINNELLYQTDRQMIQKFTGDAPFTAPFSTRSAPRMGVYIGWQIVRDFMSRNDEVSLQELLFEKNDSREILQGARYRP